MIVIPNVTKAMMTCFTKFRRTSLYCVCRYQPV